MTSSKLYKTQPGKYGCSLQRTECFSTECLSRFPSHSYSTVDLKFFHLQSPQHQACNAMIMMCLSCVPVAEPIFSTVLTLPHPREIGYNGLEARRLAEILLAGECLAPELVGQGWSMPWSSKNTRKVLTPQVLKSAFLQIRNPFILTDFSKQSSQFSGTVCD